MTSFRQIEANRRNACKSTGPITEEGKQRSRCNAVRHGLTAETVIGALEDAEDYKAFEAAIIADYDAQSAVERELVLRLPSLLWRLRRATTVETGLFEIQADYCVRRLATANRVNLFDTNLQWSLSRNRRGPGNGSRLLSTRLETDTWLGSAAGGFFGKRVWLGSEDDKAALSTSASPLPRVAIFVANAFSTRRASAAARLFLPP